MITRIELNDYGLTTVKLRSNWSPRTVLNRCDLVCLYFETGDSEVLIDVTFAVIKTEDIEPDNSQYLGSVVYSGGETAHCYRIL